MKEKWSFAFIQCELSGWPVLFLSAPCACVCKEQCHQFCNPRDHNACVFSEGSGINHVLWYTARGLVERSWSNLLYRKHRLQWTFQQSVNTWVTSQDNAKPIHPANKKFIQYLIQLLYNRQINSIAFASWSGCSHSLTTRRALNCSILSNSLFFPFCQAAHLYTG